MAKCKWKSENIKGDSCDREAIDDSGYCLYHKPDKTSEESWLFWKVINWNTTKLLTNEEKILYRRHWEWLGNEEITNYFNDKINASIKRNFSKDEIDNNLHINKLETITNEVKNANLLNTNMGKINFKGFIFPNIDSDINFNYQNDYIDDSFYVMDFSEAVFKCPARFVNYTFYCHCIFDYVKFEKTVLFYSSTFKKNTSFKNVSFSSQYLGCKIFEETFVYGDEFIFEKIIGHINIDFSQLRFSNNTNFILNDINFKRNCGEASYGENAYRIAKNQSNLYGDYESASKYRYLEQCYRGYQIFPPISFWNENKSGFKKFEFISYIINDKPHNKIIPKLWDLTMKYTIGYGEKPYNALISTVIILVVFTFAYMLVGVEINEQGNKYSINYDFFINFKPFSIKYWKEFSIDFTKILYYSICNYFTGGGGEIKDSSWIGKFLSAFEMFIGATFIGAWTATLLKKFMK